MRDSLPIIKGAQETILKKLENRVEEIVLSIVWRTEIIKLYKASENTGRMYL